MPKTPQSADLPASRTELSETGLSQTEATDLSELARNLAQQPASDSDAAAKMLGDLQREMNRLQREIRMAIQAQLAQMAGRSLGSLAANQKLAKSIQEMLDSHGLRVRCPHCGHPAILRVSQRAGVASGVFVFDHTIDGRRTFHGGKSTMPLIQLVAKPARKPRKASA